MSFNKKVMKHSSSIIYQINLLLNVLDNIFHAHMPFWHNIDKDTHENLHCYLPESVTTEKIIIQK